MKLYYFLLLIIFQNYSNSIQFNDAMFLANSIKSNLDQLIVDVDNFSLKNKFVDQKKTSTSIILKEEKAVDQELDLLIEEYKKLELRNVLSENDLYLKSFEEYKNKLKDQDLKNGKHFDYLFWSLYPRLFQLKNIIESAQKDIVSVSLFILIDSCLAFVDQYSIFFNLISIEFAGGLIDSLYYQKAKSLLPILNNIKVVANLFISKDQNQDEILKKIDELSESFFMKLKNKKLEDITKEEYLEYEKKFNIYRSFKKDEDVEKKYLFLKHVIPLIILQNKLINNPEIDVRTKTIAQMFNTKFSIFKDLIKSCFLQIYLTDELVLLFEKTNKQAIDLISFINLKLKLCNVYKKLLEDKNDEILFCEFNNFLFDYKEHACFQVDIIFYKFKWLLFFIRLYKSNQQIEDIIDKKNKSKELSIAIFEQYIKDIKNSKNFIESWPLNFEHSDEYLFVKTSFDKCSNHEAFIKKELLKLGLI